jgi:DNA-binding LacI/PurR family transcriptional regulator
MPTMVDVARRAGVAVSTVSYALSGTRPVSEATRQRVLQAVAELGYHPNVLARGLASKHTRIIALLFPSLAKGLSQGQLEFFNAAADVASQHGYALLLWTSPSEDQEILRLTKEGLVEGLLLMEIKLHDPRVDTLLKLGYPFCMIGHCQDNDGVSFVDFDFDQATRLCVQHLAELGHRYIAYLVYSPVPPELGYGPAVRSLEGIQAATRNFGVQGIVRMCEAIPQKAHATMQTLLEEHPSLSAVIVNSDVFYAGAMQAIHEKGMHIPGDFSMVAIISDRLAEMTMPPLTSVDLLATEMGCIGAELLIRRLEEGEQPPTHLILPARLTVRQSSGPCRRISA